MITREKGRSLLDFPENYTLIDVETTGYNPKYDYLIEFGALKIRNNTIIDKTSFLINANDHDINLFITKKTGITKQAIDAEGITPKEAALKIHSFLEGELIVGHNVNFDINFLYDFILDYINEKLNNDFIDTLRLSRRLIHDSDDHKLDTLLKYFEIEGRNIHRSLSDCYLTKQLLDNLSMTIETYENPEAALTKLKNSSNYIKVKASDIVTKKTEFDIDNPFYDSFVCFTGKMEKLIRKEANQLIADLGGRPQDNVTKKTSYLVIGDLNYVTNIKDGVTGKMKKAMKLNSSGQDITVLTESTFNTILDEYNI